MILWIDPGIRKLGFAIIQPDLSIVEAGIITLDLQSKAKELQRLEQYQRMLDIRNFFSQLFTTYPDISIVSMEKYFFTAINKNNAEFVFAVRGILLALATELGKEIREYTPIQLKKNVTWNSKASKETVQKVISKIFKLQDLPEYHDAADALGLCLLWLIKKKSPSA